MTVVFRFFIHLLPGYLGAKLTLFLASFPVIKPKLKDRDEIALASASTFTFKNNTRIGYSWGNGPLIILIHGWEGRASQFAPIAMALAEQGFQAVAYDGKGHGLSNGKGATFLSFQQDLNALINHFNQPVHAFVGHSAGGLSLMAAKKKHLIQAKYFITLAAPLAPYPFLASLKKVLGIKGKTEYSCQKQVAKQFNCSWQKLIDGYVFTPQKQDSQKLLAIYDQDDEMVKFDDQYAVKALWPSAHVYTTKKLGHIKILWDKGVINEICEFVEPPKTDCQYLKEAN